MTKNKTAYALIAGILAITISASFAMAEPVETKDKSIQFRTGPTPAGGMLLGPFPEIKGSVDVGKDVMSSVKIDFPEAASIAETKEGGAVVNGNLGVQNGYLVYTFSVVSDNQMRIVIVDAGDGKVLYTSEPIQSNAASLLFSGGVFHQAMPVVIGFQNDGNFTFDQQK